jgi:hypothetical protein
MNCQICKDFARLQKPIARLETGVPGLGRCINAFLAWHLSVVHGVSYLDLAVHDSGSLAEGAAAARARKRGTRRNRL